MTTGTDGQINHHDAWLGAFLSVKRGLKIGWTISLNINSSDIELLNAAKEAAGIGVVRGPYSDTYSGKPFWTWSASGEKLVSLLERVKPYVYGEFRKHIDEKIARYKKLDSAN